MLALSCDKADNGTEDEADNVVLTKDADLVLQSSAVKLGLGGEHLVQCASDGIEDDVRKEHRMRHTDARTARQFLNLILGGVGALELKDDLDTASDEACDHGAGHAVDQEGSETLIGNVPDVNVEGVGLVEQQHDNVDRNLNNKHQEDVAPRPHEAERR